MTLTKEEVKSLSLYKLSCDVEKLNHEDTKKALDQCLLNPPNISLWQDPRFYKGVAAGAVTVIILTVLANSFKK